MKTLCSVAAFLLSSQSLAGTPRLNEHSLGIAGVMIEDSAEDVLRRLGTPPTEVQDLGYITSRYIYSNVTVGFDEATVAEIFSTSRHACTLQGLCPGDPASKMIAIYGEPVEVVRESGTYSEYYGEGGYSCWYQFALSDVRVKSVGVICQP